MSPNGATVNSQGRKPLATAKEQHKAPMGRQ
jgi:hypothetical protein